MTTLNISSLEKKKQPRPSFLKKFPFLKKLPKDCFNSLLPWEEPFVFFKRLSNNDPIIFLDAVSFREELPRSVVAWDPWLWVRGRKGYLEFNVGEGWKSLKSKTPYEDFRDIFKTIQQATNFPEGMGAFGVLSYEAGELFEKLPEAEKPEDRIYFEFIFPRNILLFDQSKKELRYLSCAGTSLKKSVSISKKSTSTQSPISNFRPQLKQREFQTIVERAKAYIRAGDIYQANLSQDFLFSFKGDPVALYGRLRTLNPSPFSAFVRLGKKLILSSSPELLLRKSGKRCLTRPIAGTKPRGKDRKTDQALSRALLLSPKEKAEHLMLLDLERNDLGRVCEFGTVGVEERMILERYSHVVHIVSQVAGKMRPQTDAFDLIRALFPGGTITGCPKIRSMKIIYELEKKPRELYTGSLGFLGFSGEAVFNIIIRTIVFNGHKGSLRVGAGIVADSDPTREYWETIQKGKALFQALGIRR